LYNIAGKELISKMDNICSHLYKRPSNDDEIEEATNKINQYKFIDASKIYSEFVDLREKGIKTKEVLRLFNELKDSDFKKAKRQIMFNFSNVLLNHGIEEKVLTIGQSKSFDKYLQISIYFAKFIHSKKYQNQNKFKIDELVEEVKKCLGRDRLTKSKAKEYLKTVFDLELLSDRRTYKLKDNQYIGLENQFHQFLELYDITVKQQLEINLQI